MTCDSCNCQIIGPRFIPQMGLLKACDACTEMWLAAARNWWLVQAQAEHVQELEKRRAILNGE